MVNRRRGAVCHAARPSLDGLPTRSLVLNTYLKIALLCVSLIALGRHEWAADSLRSD
jgi:hypothetical protein